MTNIKHKFNAIIILALAIFVGFAGEISAKDINGYYFSDDGGSYYVRQIGSKIYWVGEKPDGSYANVFAGTVVGTKISGKWWDIPKGKAKGGGEVSFEISNGGDTLTKISSSSPFGTKKLAVLPKLGGVAPSVEDMQLPLLRSKPEGFRDASNTLTGAWNGDDYATYYIREMPNGDVVWFAENNLWGDPGGLKRPNFAQVFIGKKIGGLVTGDWVNITKGKATGNNVVSLKVVNQQELKLNNPPVGIEADVLQRSLPNSLQGFADLHTHPMVHLALGRKFIHGVPDVGSLIPADQDCAMNLRAKSIAHALGRDNSTHGGTGWFGIDNRCGDNLRQAIIDQFQEALKGVVTPDNAVGYPTFKDYPKYNDLTHQKMWVDWMRRAYHGGQRVLIALAMNNQTLATGVSGPGDGPVTDKESADLQITEMKAFVKRHNDFMEVAYSAADVRRIVAANKMAVVLGIEIDNIGNFINGGGSNDLKIMGEITRLHAQGVRYVFPVHLVDNHFGGTAIYQDLFNLSNYHINHKFWNFECSKTGDGITHRFEVQGKDDLFKYEYPLAGAKALKLGIDIARFPNDPPKCEAGQGHVNKMAVSTNFAPNMNPLNTLLESLMRKGMLIDIDHSSIKTINAILKKAETQDYPVVSGHTGLRADLHNENSRTPEQLARIAKLGGMFGLGTDNVKADKWIAEYLTAGKSMKPGQISFGSDLNGLVKGAQPRVSPSDFAKQTKCMQTIYSNGLVPSETGDKKWNYCSEGVAHYGLMADFVKDVKNLPNGQTVNSNLMKNAEAFAQMWEKAEKNGKK